jgi:uncharacterized protein (TIGR00251 family)
MTEQRGGGERQQEGWRDELGGKRGNVLLVRVTAPALDGRANQAVRRLLAKRLGVATSRVVIVRGQRSRDKVIEVEGTDQKTVDAELGP